MEHKWFCQSREITQTRTKVVKNIIKISQRVQKIYGDGQTNLADCFIHDLVGQGDKNIVLWEEQY